MVTAPRNPFKNLFGLLRRDVSSKKLDSAIKDAARCMAEGKICLFPSEGVYTLALDGKNIEVVTRLREIKGRETNKREGIIAPPERLFELMDFSFFKRNKINIDKKKIKALYEVNPLGLIVPCNPEKVPEHLITYREVNGEKVPTIMNIWNSKYKIYRKFWKELSKYPHVFWVGTSANKSNQHPMNFRGASTHFAPFLGIAVEDPYLETHPFQGSYTMIDLIQDPPAVSRKGSIHPEYHPKEFEKFYKVLPNLVILKN